MIFLQFPFLLSSGAGDEIPEIEGQIIPKACNNFCRFEFEHRNWNGSYVQQEGNINLALSRCKACQSIYLRGIAELRSIFCTLV